MSDYDGFIGWMVFAWTLVIGAALYWWYGRRADNGDIPHLLVTNGERRQWKRRRRGLQ